MTDDPTIPAHAPLWRRVLARLGVFSVWGAGLLVTGIALLLIGTIGLSRLPAGHRLTFSLANRALETSSNLRLSARGSLLLEHGADLKSPLLEIVDSTGVRHPLLRAKNARLVTSWWGLLSRNPQEIRVELEEPVVTLTRLGKSGYLLPAFRTRTSTGSRPSPISVDLDLRNATVLVVGGGAPGDTLARALDLVGRMHGAGRTWDFALGRFSATLPNPGLRIEKAEGRMRVAEDRLALDRLRMRTGAGWIEAEGAGPLTPRFDIEGRIRAGEWTWHDLARLLRQPALDIPGGIAGTAGLRVRPDTLLISGANTDLLWRDEPARARFEATWAKGQLSLHAARVEWRRTTFTGGFGLDTHAARWRLEGALERLELAELPQLWPMPKQERLLVSGDLVLTGDRAGLQGRVARGRGTWRELAFDSLAGTWSLAGKTQALDARVRAAGASVALEGTLAPGRLAADVRASRLDARRVPASWWRDLGISPVPRGTIESLEARLDGPPARPRVNGTATVSDFADGALSAGEATLGFDGALGSAWSGRATLVAHDARAGFARADSAYAEAEFSPARIDVRRFFAERAESTLTASGSAVRVRQGWDIRLEEVDWRAGDRLALAAEGPVELRWDANGTLEVRRARVVSTAGTLTAKGRWGGSQEASDLTLDLETLDLAALLGPIAEGAGVRGIVTGHARLEGPSDRADWTVNLEATDLHYKAWEVPRFVARGRFAQDAWEVSELVLDTGEGRIGFKGSLTWADGAPWSGDLAAWNRALARSPGWAGTLTTDSLSLRKLADFAPQTAGAHGFLSARAELSGRPSAPLVAVTGKLLRPGWGQGALSDFDLDLDYRDDLLTVRRFANAGPDSIGPAVTGTLPIRLGWGIPAAERLPDRPMRLVAHARGVDLGLLPLILPPVAAASGHMDLDAVLGGTPKHPNLAGSIFVRDGVIRPANREEVLTGVTGTIRLDGPNLALSNFEARQGKQGRITIAQGTGHVRNLRITDYAFDVAVNHFTAFSSGEYVLEFDGKLHVENGVDRGGPMPLPHLTGRIDMIEGQFLTNLADPARQAAWQGPAAAPPWTYRIGIEALKNVWWRPADANIEAELEEFEIVQTPTTFLMLGQIEALRGRYYFLGNQFDVETGRLFFDASEPMNPTVDATLTTRKPSPDLDESEPETITLTVTGRAFEPTVNLTSSPSNLSQTKIAELLTYGQLQTESGVKQVGAQYLARQLTRQFPELEQHFGYIEVGQAVDKMGSSSQTTTGTETAKSYTTVGVSRYFTQDLLLRYSQVVGGVDDKNAQSVDYLDISAEYRLSRLLFLRGQVTRRKGSQVTTADQYNLDVRARYEY